MAQLSVQLTFSSNSKIHMTTTPQFFSTRTINWQSDRNILLNCSNNRCKLIPRYLQKSSLPTHLQLLQPTLPIKYQHKFQPRLSSSPSPKPLTTKNNCHQFSETTPWIEPYPAYTWTSSLQSLNSLEQLKQINKCYKRHHLLFELRLKHKKHLRVCHRRLEIYPVLYYHYCKTIT